MTLFQSSQSRILGGSLIMVIHGHIVLKELAEERERLPWADGGFLKQVASDPAP